MHKEFIELLKSKISIVDIVSSRIRLKKKGSDWFGLCPFHKEKTGSFKVDESKGLFYCFGCGAGGDTIKFVMDFDKISFQEAVELLAHQYGLEIPKEKDIKASPFQYLYDILNISKNYFIEKLNDKIGKGARDYLELRKISNESVEKFQLGFAPDNTELYSLLREKGYNDIDLIRTGIFIKSNSNHMLINRYKHRLIFPILNSVGLCIGFGGRILSRTDRAKYINSPETEIYKKSEHLYSYNLAKKGKTRKIIITEGYLDVISLHQAGFDGAVAPLGTSISEIQINMCWKICNTPVIALDGDNAGIKASYRWVDKILYNLQPGKSFNFAILPQNTDPDLLLYNNQKSIIDNAILNAKPLSQWLWDGAFILYPSQTPEQKSELIQMLLNKVSNIQNTSLKKLYIHDIKKREYELYKIKNKVINHENLHVTKSAIEKIEQMLIVILLKYPYIINSVIEDLVKCEFRNARARNLKEKILNYYNEVGYKEFDKFIEYMNLIFNENIGIFTSIDSYSKLIEESISSDKIAVVWNKLFFKYLSITKMNNDLQKAEDSLKYSFSEDDWQRFKALKKEIISDRIK